MVSQKVTSQLPFLQQLSKANTPAKRSLLLSQIRDEQLEALVEICYNVCAGGFRLETKNLKKLSPHRDFVRRLSRKRTPKSAKFVVQKGAGFPFAALLLPIILSILGKENEA